jgi:hypothetical protein
LLVKNLQSQGNVEDFFQTASTNGNAYWDLMLRELVGFHQYSIDVKNKKCALSWWHKEQNKFQTLAILGQHILEIHANQIETKLVVGIWIALQRCRLQTENMDKFVFVHKNWQFDLWIGCLKPIDVASTCEAKSNLVVELEVEFENQISNEDFLDLDDSS